MAKGKMTGKRRIFRLNNMTGGMVTMAEDNAYLTFDPNASLGAGLTQIPFEFKRVENWNPINRGGQSKTFGFSLEHSTGSSTPIRSIGRYKKADGTNQFIFSQGTNAYYLSAGVATTLGVTLADAYHHLEVARDTLIICDGTNIPKTWDGSSANALAAGADGTAATGFKQVLFYQNRLFGFSATHDPSLLYYSDAGVLSTGYSTNFVNCDINDGQKITGIAPFFIPGELTPVIIVAKERSVGIVTGTGTVADPYTFVKISRDLGVPGFRQIVQFNQDAAFFTPKGINSYQTAVKNINIAQAFLTGKVLDQFTSLPASTLSDALGWYDWKNRRVSFAVTASGSYPDTIWHYDVDLGCMYKQTGFNTTAAFVDTDGTLYTGDNTGKIYQHETTVHAYNDSAINATLRTPPLDFFEPHYYKRIVDAKIKVRGDGSYSLGVATYYNNDTVTGPSHTIPITAGEYTWNGGLWTSDPDEYQWGASPLKFKKFFPSNIFENISFEFTQSGANQPVDLLEVLFEVEYLDLI